MGRIDVDFRCSDQSVPEAVIKVYDETLIGKQVRFGIKAEVKVHDSRGIDVESTLFETSAILGSTEVILPIGDAVKKAFSYKGRMIDIVLSSEVKINDGIIFDTKLSEAQEKCIEGKPEILSDAMEVIEPADAFNLASNLMAVSPKDRIQIIFLFAVGAVLILLNTLLGWHDQMSPEPATYFYSHRDSDGDSQSPLVNSLMASGTLGAGVWFAIRLLLRRYMAFTLKPPAQTIKRGQSMLVSELVSGVSRVYLHRPTLRIVGCNMECGEYKRGSGTSERTVSFVEPVNAVVLFEKKLEFIRAGEPVERHFQDRFSFDPMFAALYPPLTVTSTHRLEIYWEVQLLIDEFVDQELVGPVDKFCVDDFWTA